jgi:hypothetical protein
VLLVMKSGWGRYCWLNSSSEALKRDLNQGWPSQGATRLLCFVLALQQYTWCCPTEKGQNSSASQIDGMWCNIILQAMVLTADWANAAQQVTVGVHGSEPVSIELTTGLAKHNHPATVASPQETGCEITKDACTRCAGSRLPVAAGAIGLQSSTCKNNTAMAKEQRPTHNPSSCTLLWC